MTEEEKESGCSNAMEVESHPKSTKTVDFEDMPVLLPENPKSNGLTKDDTSAPMEVDPSLCVQQSAPDIAEGASNSSSSSENDKTPQNDSNTCHTPTNQSKLESSFLNTPTSASGSKKRKRLTPEERVIKDQERQEKRRKLEEEKQRKEQERLEKIRIKEEERKKREEEKRLKEEERKQKEEERLRKAEEDRVKKEEERQRKEEERVKKEEERKKKEEEKLFKDEQRRKKEEERKKLVEEKEREKQKTEEVKAKQAQMFTSFFKMTPPSKSRSTSLNANTTLPDAESENKENNETSDLEIIEIDIQPSESTPSNGERAVPKRRIALTEKKLENIFNPMPFQLKTDMNLAPLLRRPPLSIEEKCAVDKLTNDNSKGENAVVVEDLECIESNISEQKLGYFEELKKRGGRKSDRTEVKYESEVQVITGNLIDNPKESGLIKWRIKLIQFHENRRPPYWGTYKRKALRVKGRKPFIQEQDLDYEFDSDDEWEDEPEDAEDLENSDKEDEKEPDDPDGVPEDEEDEEGWMVPHGYLSDGEGGDHVDLETKKTQEKEFYKSLKLQTKIGYPVIETDALSEFKIILFPGSGRRKIRRSCRSRKAPSPSQLVGRTGGGILSLELPNSDNDDEDWTDDDSSDSENSSSDTENESDVSCGDITPNEDLLSSDSEDESCAHSKLPVKGKRNDSAPQQLKKSKLKITPLTGGVSAEQA